MKLILLGLGFFGSTLLAAARIQSEFRGPVALSVWQHWQASWNVERDRSFPETFRLTRGWEESQKPFVDFYWEGSLPGDIAFLTCEGLRRKGEWEVEPFRSQIWEARARLDSGKSHFDFAEVESCLDIGGKSLATKLIVQVRRDNQMVFEYALIPMYVRGKDLGYWDNQIVAYSAHAGAGSIRVSTQLAGEQGWDTWDGTRVEPRLTFGDLNHMTEGSEIGLHRHVTNQEMYLVAEGKLKVENGVAPLTGNSARKVRRLFDAVTGEFRDVEQFQAEGGWIESRVIEPQQFSLIVPHPGNGGTVYFHGARAVTPCAFWTMGARN